MSIGFDAPLDAGGLRLVVPGAAADAVDAALALGAHEPLVAALETALGAALDPRPLAEAGADDIPRLWVEAAGGVRLGWSWPLLFALAGPPACAIAWPALAFEVDVAGFDASPRPAGAGAGVLLLPPAFDEPWRVALHAPAAGLAAAAVWRGPGTAPALEGRPAVAAAPRARWRVQLAAPWSCALPALLGWSPAEPAPAGDAAWLVGPAGVEARGRIAPAFGGAGLWIDAADDGGVPEARAWT